MKIKLTKELLETLRIARKFGSIGTATEGVADESAVRIEKPKKRKRQQSKR